MLKNQSFLSNLKFKTKVFVLKNIKTIVVLGVAAIAVPFVRFRSEGDFYHMFFSTDAVVSFEWANIYPSPSFGTSLTGWIGLIVLPYFILGFFMAPYPAFAIAGIVALVLLVWSVKVFTQQMYPSMRESYVWVLAGASAFLPTTVAAWLEYYHPQDVAGVAFLLFGLVFVAKGKWLPAALLFSVALLTRQWVLLAFFVTAPFLRRDMFKFVFTTALVTFLGVIPFLLYENAGFLDAVLAKHASIPDHTFWGRLAWTGSVPLMNNFLFFKALPVLVSLGAGIWLWKTNRVSPEKLLPFVTAALALRMFFETAAYGYYWMPLAVLLLVAARQPLALLVSFSFSLPMAFLLYSGLPPATTAGIFLSVPLGVILVAFFLGTPKHSHRAGDDMSNQEGEMVVPSAPVWGVETRKLSPATPVVALISFALLIIWTGSLNPRETDYENVLVPESIELTSGKIEISPEIEEKNIGETGWIVESLKGENFIKRSIVVTPDGSRSTLLVFWSHWCEECVAEWNALTQWAKDNRENTQVVLVAQATRPDKGNSPQTVWLHSIGWEEPVMVDDENGSFTKKFFDGEPPGYVLLDAEGTVEVIHEGFWEEIFERIETKVNNIN